MTDPIAPAQPPVAPPPVPAPPPTPAAAPVPPPSTDPTAELARLQGELAEWKAQSRKHEDRWKAAADREKVTDGLLKTLAEKAGVPMPNGSPDPAALATQVEQAQAGREQAARELAVFRAAAASGANADLLMDSRSFMTKAAAIDPAAMDYTDQVKRLVADHVAANPAVAMPVGTPPVPVVPQLPATSGGQFQVAPQAAHQWTMAEVDAASPEQLVKAMEAGLLQSMGFGRGKSHRR